MDKREGDDVLTYYSDFRRVIIYGHSSELRLDLDFNFRASVGVIG